MVRFRQLTKRYKVRNVQDAIEEQRRVLYVAITRTTKTLVLSSARQLPLDLAHKLQVRFVRIGANARTIASRFISELGADAPNGVTGGSFLATVGVP